MPNIKGYDAPDNIGLNPTDRGSDALAGAARRVGGFYSQVAGATEQLGAEKNQMWKSLGANAASDINAVGDVAVKTMDHQQIGKGMADGTQMMANINQQWEDFAKRTDPNDTTAAKRFNNEVLEPALEDFQKNFDTENSQAWAESFVAKYRQNMFEKATATMAQKSADAVAVNLDKGLNNLASAVSSDPTPHSIDNAFDVIDHSIGATVRSSPMLSADQAASIESKFTQHAKEQIVKSAIVSMISKNPNIDLSAVQQKYGDYIKGDEMNTFQRAAQVQAKANTLTDKQTAIAQRQLSEQNVHAAATKTITDNVQVDPQTNQTTIKPQFFKDALDIARRNPDAPNAAETVRTMLNWGEAQQNKENKAITDPTVASAIDARMFTADDPVSKMDILKAEASGKLSRSDAEIRTKIIDQRDRMPADPQFKLAMDGAKELIEGRTVGEKSLQSGKYAAFVQQFLGDYQRQKATGALPPNALSLRDPNSLLSKTMEAYKSPLAAAISGNGGVSATPTPAPSSVPPPATASKYSPGDVVNTSEGPRRFKGGNFRDKANWEPVS
jgi:hypothetical protein